ncbi:hypothetical protein B296_00048715 [Ensete ventricosum]|uniref:Uncharacterized protein n=1 Tax=Ensete ventricosum TaxID=4639 RepID=A0A426YTS2_ENSVE|nr:hypothetical protein B296_00048715 [Ensete ventricosum]
MGPYLRIRGVEAGVEGLSPESIARLPMAIRKPWTGMSRAILALSLYDLSWSPRPNGDCTMPDDVVRWVSAPTVVHHPHAVGRPSPCQVNRPCSRSALSRPRRLAYGMVYYFPYHK